MRIPTLPHRWNIPVRTAVALQRRLASRVRLRPMTGSVRWIAGLDAAFTSDEGWCIAGVVLWDVRDRCVVEQRWARARLRFPYIPGLLSFREAPALLAAVSKLLQEPDCVMCDGQGLAHPRRLGIASHLGLCLERPTIGCAKSLLLGRHAELGVERGSQVDLLDGDEVIGRVIRTRRGVRPVYVSVGHLVDLDSACDLVLRSGNGYRLPEPTRLADQLVARVKQQLSGPPSP